MLNSALRHALHFLEPIGFLWGCLVVLTVVLYRRQQRRLAAALDGLPAHYAYVIIDLPPSLGLLTLNALVASDGVVVPLQSEYYAMEGISELVRTINAVRRGPNPRPASGAIDTSSLSRPSRYRKTFNAPGSSGLPAVPSFPRVTKIANLLSTATRI